MVALDYVREIKSTVRQIRFFETRVQREQAILRDLRDKLAHLYLCQAELEVHDANREEPIG
jgi:hypothetical protein